LESNKRFIKILGTTIIAWYCSFPCNPELGKSGTDAYDIEEQRFLGTIDCTPVEELSEDAIFDSCTLSLANLVSSGSLSMKKKTRSGQRGGKCYDLREATTLG